MKRYIYSVIIYLAVILFAVNTTFAQLFNKDPDERLSSIPKSLKDSTRVNPEVYLPILTERLTSGIADEFEKVKIIHDWIATEITYDTEIYLRRTDYVHKTYDVLREKRAICIGYCNLFNLMCAHANIESASIVGYAKTVSDREETLPKNFTKPNHLWNAVKIKGRWYLLDVTWNAGQTVRGAFVFNYSTTYLLIDPKIFIANHFPLDEKWQLLEKPVTWSEFRKLTFKEPTEKLSLDKSALKAGINFSRLFNTGIPGINETHGYNLSFSVNRGITNELGMELEISLDHMKLNQDVSLLLSDPNFNSERGTYSDPLTRDPVKVGNFSFEKIGVGVNFKYHMRNETSLLPFLKTGFSVSSPFSFSNSENGILVRNAGFDEVRRLDNFNFLDQLLYGVLFSAGADLVKKEAKQNTYHPIIGIELRWNLMLNSLRLFEDYDEGWNKFKSYSINLMFYL